MLNDPETCIYERFSNEEFKLMRTEMIDLVLATDMSFHFKDQAEYKERLVSPDFDPTKGSDKKRTMNMIIHLSDISNPGKPWHLCFKWIDLLFIEFFNQGDKEKQLSLPVSYLMDRHTTNIAKEQSGFIENLIKPAFNVLSTILPKTKIFVDQMNHNTERWKELETAYEIILNQSNKK